MLVSRSCNECGRRYQQTREHQVFCSEGCRRACNKRRLGGGYELYPLIMRWRIERPAEALAELTTVADRLAGIEREIRTRRQARIAATENKLPSECPDIARQRAALETALQALPAHSAAWFSVAAALTGLRVKGVLHDREAVADAKRNGK